MSRKPWAQVAVLVLSLVPASLAYAALLGLGMHRHAASWAVSLTASVLLFGPPLLIAALVRRHRLTLLGLTLGAWALALLAGMPVYFPGERTQAVVTGLSLVRGGEHWERATRALAESLPPEPAVAQPEVPEATALVEEPSTPAPAFESNQIPLPFEGAGRRMSIPVVFDQDDAQRETWMMLDTGATYTTLSDHMLAELGLEPTPDAPVIRLHTANGERDAQVVLVQRVWLGDLFLDGVAIATCEACSSADTAGLLGLNVSGNYNMNIDSDRREVVFTSRADRNRRLDVKPFTEVKAHVSRFPGGRIEVTVGLHNNSPRDIEAASVAVHCDEHEWEVSLEPIPAGGVGEARRRLPVHEPCDQYQVSLHSAAW